MVRKARIEFEGAAFHVINYGNQGHNIFRDDKDYMKYIEILGHYRNRHKYLLYSYALMPDHLHLLVEIKDIPLSKTFQGINQSYTIYFNKRYKVRGHLFQGRYRAILFDREKYLLPLVRHVHFNPVRAGLVKSPDEYRYSSHRHYAGRTSRNNIIDRDHVLGIFSGDMTTAVKRYREYMSDHSELKTDEMFRAREQMILGGESFMEFIKKKYHVKLSRETHKKEYSLSEIADGIEKVYGITIKQIRHAGRAGEITRVRKIFAITANKYGYKSNEIARYIRKDPAIVTRYISGKTEMKKQTEKVIRTLRTEKETASVTGILPQDINYFNNY